MTSEFESNDRIKGVLLRYIYICVYVLHRHETVPWISFWRENV